MEVLDPEPFSLSKPQTLSMSDPFSLETMELESLIRISSRISSFYKLSLQPRMSTSIQGIFTSVRGFSYNSQVLSCFLVQVGLNKPPLCLSDGTIKLSFQSCPVLKSVSSMGFQRRFL